jgi:uncharacterized membrane protein YcjF (UPF0283 family)
MNPFLWLLLVLAAAVVAVMVASFVLWVVKEWRSLPPARRERT